MSSEQPWTVEQHRDFAVAIYEAGMRSSSPAVILHNMQPTHETITSERVKSHLQKYRGNRSKAKAEFMAAYDRWMAKAISLTNDLNRPIGGNHVDDLRARNPSAVAELRELMNPANHALGEMAAYLGFLVMVQEKRRRAVERAGGASLPSGVALTKRSTGPKTVTAATNLELLGYLDYKSVTFPQLTSEEMDSPLGQGLEYTKKLLSMINSHLDSQRHPQLQLNRKRLRSGQKVLMPSEKQREHPTWGNFPARRGQSFQRESSSGWHSSALGSSHGHAGEIADSTSGDSISPQTSTLLEAVAQASAVMQPTWLSAVEGESGHPMHGEHLRSHSEKREAARSDENLRNIDLEDLSPSSLRFGVEEHMMGEQLHTERAARHHGNSIESTQVVDTLVGDRRRQEYGIPDVHHQYHASEAEWSHGIRPDGRWEYDKELQGSLSSAEANLPWQSRNRHTNALNEERRRQTNEVMSYRRGDPRQGGDTHAHAAPESTNPWGAPPHS